MVDQATFGAFDYVVFALMLGVSSSIGIYYRLSGGKQKTTQEYLLGDKSLGILPVGFSLVASFMSAITILGVSSENYIYGTQFVVINISYLIGTPIAAYLFLPVFFKLGATSVYEYLQLRFGVVTRLLCSIAFSLQMILYMGIVLYAPALALSAVTSLSLVVSILSMGLVCTFYSTIGGMKAVVTTDVFQSALMFAAIFCVIIKAAIDAGGLGEIWKLAEEGSRIEFLNFDPDMTVRHTVWSLIIGGMFTFLSLYAVNQAQVQRLLSLKDLKASQRALWASFPILVCLSLCTSFSGLAIYSRYQNCDPVASKQIKKYDQLMPFFVIETMGNIPGLSGLFVAGIFSGSLSTVSSALNSLAAVSLEDYIKPLYSVIQCKRLPEKYCSIISKFLALAYGILCLAFAFLAQSFGGVLQASLTVFGVVGGPLLGVFTLGMFIPCANQMGAVVGLLTSMAISLWIGFGGPKPPIPSLPISTSGCESDLFMEELNSSRLLNVTTSAWSSKSFVPHVSVSTAGYGSDLYSTEFNSSALISSTISTPTGGEEDYFILYKLSYLWCVVLAFLLTFLIGILVSMLVGRRLGKWGSRNLSPDLFCPIVRTYLIKKRRKESVMEIDVTVVQLDGLIKSNEETFKTNFISDL